MAIDTVRFQYDWNGITLDVEAEIEPGLDADETNPAEPEDIRDINAYVGGKIINTTELGHFRKLEHLEAVPAGLGCVLSGAFYNINVKDSGEPTLAASSYFIKGEDVYIWVSLYDELVEAAFEHYVPGED